MNAQPETFHPHEDTTQISTAPPPAPPSTLRKVFFGADGIRAGWGLVIFLAIFAVLVFAVNFTLRKLGVPTPDPKQEMSASLAIITEGATFLLCVLVTWIMSKIERRPIAVYGLGDSRKLPRFLAGFGWGFVCLSLLVACLVKSGLLVFDRRLIFGSDVFRYGAIWMLGFLLVGLLEEYLTRGYVLYTLARGLSWIYERVFKTKHGRALGFWTSAIIFCSLFGLGHSSNPGESPIGEVAAGLAGLVFCLSLWRTGSLWWAIGFHASWDWSQSFLYGVPDSGLMAQHHLFATHPVGRAVLSGGTTGPEGSSYILGVFVLIVLIILFTLRDGESYAAKLPQHRAG